MASVSHHMNAEKKEPWQLRALVLRRGQTDGPTPNEAEGQSKAIKQ